MSKSLNSALRRTLFLVALAVAAFFGWRAAAQRSQQPSSEASAKPAAGVFHPTKEQWAALKVAEVKALPFRNTLSTDGNVAFDEDALTPVFSPYSGRVSRVFAKLGDVVKKGAPLMAVDAAEFVQGRSDVAAAKAALDAARATEKRQHDLFEAGAAALKDWRQAQADLAAAQATYAAARGRLGILGKTEADIHAPETGAAGPTDAVVTAPIGGTVTQRQVGVGQYITSAATGASTPVFTIGDLSKVWLVANARESDAPALRVGQPVEVGVLALPGRTFAAKITWVGAAVDAATHRLPVRAEAQNRDGLLKPLMFATISVATSEPVQAPAVPESAIVYEGETARVFVARDDGSVVVRKVRAGRRQDDMIEIVDGLHAGEKVVTAGTLFVDRATAGD